MRLCNKITRTEGYVSSDGLLEIYMRARSHLPRWNSTTQARAEETTQILENKYRCQQKWTLNSSASKMVVDDVDAQ